jgi:hypothetical protein
LFEAAVSVPWRQGGESSSPSRGHLGLELVLRGIILPSSRDAGEAESSWHRKDAKATDPEASLPGGTFDVVALPALRVEIVRVVV